jgi:hypothetical protein
VIDLDATDVVEMPVPQLARRILLDIAQLDGVTAAAYADEAERGIYEGDAAVAIAGALGWLQGQGLVAVDPRSGSASGALVVTPTGRRASGAT